MGRKFHYVKPYIQLNIGKESYIFGIWYFWCGSRGEERQGRRTENQQRVVWNQNFGQSKVELKPKFLTNMLMEVQTLQLSPP